MRPGDQPAARDVVPAWRAVLSQPNVWRMGRAARYVLALGVLAVLILAGVTLPTRSAEAEQQFRVWRSEQFGLSLSHPTTWTVVEQRSDSERGDVLILGNETSALLVGLLHDTRTPRQMADDLIMTQKEQTPDLAVVESSETPAGSVLMFLQYTIRPGSDEATLIDEKVLLGTLQAGASTITLRGMVPDRANVAEQFEEIESIIGTLAPDR